MTIANNTERGNCEEEERKTCCSEKTSRIITKKNRKQVLAFVNQGNYKFVTMAAALLRDP